VEMEQARKGKALEPAGAWALAAPAKERGKAPVAVGPKAGAKGAATVSGRDRDGVNALDK
jgi:hypothetical protein